LKRPTLVEQGWRAMRAVQALRRETAESNAAVVLKAGYGRGLPYHNIYKNIPYVSS